MLPCHDLWDLEEQRGRGFKFIIRREGEKSLTGTFMGRHKKTAQGVDHWATLSGITYYFSLLWCKKIYTQDSFLLKLISKEVWIDFSSWIYFHLHYWFFYQSANGEWAFAFLNTAIIIFCLMYSLNIPHQTPSFFPV